MNRFVRFEYNEHALPSIDDYKKDGILPLDSALESVLSQVDQLDHYIGKAKKLRHYPSEHDLTQDESTAIYLYTDDWNDRSLNRILNQALQSQDRALLKPWLDFLKLFNHALDKLPIVKDTIWRGLPIDIANQLKDNEQIVCWGITSCSTSADIMNIMLDQNSILCSIKPLNGKKVHGYTPYDSDQEVLLLPGTRLLVKSNEHNHGMEKTVIYLEEISEASEEEILSSDVPMISPQESVNEDEIDNNHHRKVKATTSTNRMNNKSLPDKENSKENETKAVIIFSNGDRYKLTYQNGKKQGYGKYCTVGGDKFHDQAADEKANGEGICAFKNGNRFIGVFERGIRHGHGILYNVNGPIQAGDWANDEPINQNLEIISNSNGYEWMDGNNKTRRYGVYSDENGNRYIGNVDDGKAHGLGIRYWSDGSRYEGHFKDDQKHGYGIYVYTDRDKYVGQWDNDEINGNGRIAWASGANYEGEFINGKRQGQGKLIFANQTIQEGIWQNDEYVS